MKLSIIFIFSFLCLFVVKAEDKHGLVNLSEKLPKITVRPLELSENKEFSLYHHPFNSEVYWVVNDSLFDSSLDQVTTYGFSISLPSAQTIKSVFDGLDKSIRFTTHSFGKNKYCKFGYINESKSKVIIKLYFNNQLLVVSGNEFFVKQNVDLAYYCNR
ncbi:hypothetical protein E0Z06_01020 [Rheinheimera sp. D18]|uniref:hypothetical protein n=1 Tax=Rheinheimera sp. D18 TaxID=2545632 RepID=UPI00104B37E8|nr:hypothetical protein [Rheinheimera sp. D18]QBL08193.1 hypothetical protein E0Z06_01020 [Rheinheimera sp. D18]